MRILVTGATGFVGSAIVRSLRASDHHVIVLARSRARAIDMLPGGVDIREGDMLEPSTYVPIVAEVDAVIHAAQLAIPGRLTRSRSERLFAADDRMTHALADECTRLERRLVYTGGCFDWGDHGENWIDESTPLNPSPMGVGHARQAQILDERHIRDGLDVVRISPGFVYGPGGLLKSAFVDQARLGRLRCIGKGDNWWSCVHVDDLAEAYTLAVAQARPGAAFAVADGEPIRLRALTDAVTDAMSVSRVGTAPKALLALFLGGTLVDSLVTSFRISPTRIRSELGWSPRHPRFIDAVEEVVAASP